MTDLCRHFIIFCEQFKKHILTTHARTHGVIFFLSTPRLAIVWDCMRERKTDLIDTQNLENIWCMQTHTHHTHTYLYIVYMCLCVCRRQALSSRPTLFTTSELQHPLHDVFELHTISGSPDLEALKWWKSQMGLLTTCHEISGASSKHM